MRKETLAAEDPKQLLLYLSMCVPEGSTKINGSTARGQMLLLNGSVPFYFFAGGYF